VSNRCWNTDCLDVVEGQVQAQYFVSPENRRKEICSEQSARLEKVTALFLFILFNDAS
jgi:hypothetical protein